MKPQEMYLDLMKKILTDTIYDNEPDHDDSNMNHFIHGFVHHYIRGRAYSMLPVKRLDNIQECLNSIERDQIPGDLIETGVWRGGSVIFMRAYLKVFGIMNRKVWVADSFEGLPEPDTEKFPLEAKAHSSKLMTEEFRHLAVSLEQVVDNFKRFGLFDDQVGILKGWFKDTLPVAPINRLALLRLDGDYYESTRDSLTNLYPKLSVGGYVIIDDYGEDEWTYCRKAVNDYRSEHGISEELVKVDRPCYYWKKVK
jgi:hypothetical protein